MRGNFAFFEVMAETFSTISIPGHASFRELGSKFLSFAHPVRNEDDIAHVLKDLHEKYPDATHHCYAWQLGNSGERWRVWDDGEPGHSAGDPILGQIRSAGLTFALVVVVRYFGGTKLGVSGLIQAYRQAARMAIEQARLITVEITETWSLSFPYSEMQRIMSGIKAVDGKIRTLTTGETCELVADVATRRNFSKRVEDWKSRQLPVLCQILSEQ